MAMNPTNFQYDTAGLRRKDRDHNVHPWTDFSTFREEGSLVVAESEGCYVYDSEGNRYLDGIGGLWCVNIGYGNDEMAQAIADQVRRMTYYSSFGHITTPPAAELAAKLATLTPAPLNHRAAVNRSRDRRRRDPRSRARLESDAWGWNTRAMVATGGIEPPTSRL